MSASHIQSVLDFVSALRHDPLTTFRKFRMVLISDPNDGSFSNGDIDDFFAIEMVQLIALVCPDPIELDIWLVTDSEERILMYHRFDALLRQLSDMGHQVTITTQAAYAAQAAGTQFPGIFMMHAPIVSSEFLQCMIEFVDPVNGRLFHSQGNDTGAYNYKATATALPGDVNLLKLLEMMTTHGIAAAKTAQFVDHAIIRAIFQELPDFTVTDELFVLAGKFQLAKAIALNGLMNLATGFLLPFAPGAMCFKITPNGILMGNSLRTLLRVLIARLPDGIPFPDISPEYFTLDEFNGILSQVISLIPPHMVMAFPRSPLYTSIFAGLPLINGVDPALVRQWMPQYFTIMEYVCIVCYINVFTSTMTQFPSFTDVLSILEEKNVFTTAVQVFDLIALIDVLPKIQGLFLDETTQGSSKRARNEEKHE